jgi:hypothetical protein
MKSTSEFLKIEKLNFSNDQETFKIKVVDLEKLGNFLVYNCFI